MKIYILQPNDIVRPASGYRAPEHNLDWGVEQSLEYWLYQHPELITDNPNEADFDYLSIYFNRFYTAHWGSDESVEILQSEILRCVSRNRPTFTICEYGIKTLQHNLDLCNMIIFTAGRMAKDDCIDIPLLCSPHEWTPEPSQRKWLASFMGKFETNEYREYMRQALDGRQDVYLSAGQGTRPYVELLANSEIALAPRGFTGQSFRFYEAMQFATVPLLIGDLDTRPFKQWIDWDSCSLYTNDANKLPELLDLAKQMDLRAMGEQARYLWQEHIHYGKWEQYVIRELNSRL